MLEFAVARSGCVRAPDTNLSSFVKIPFSVSVAWSQVSWLLREDPFLKVSLPHNTRVQWRRACTLTSRLPLPRRFTRSWFYSKQKKRGGILQQIAIRVCILATWNVSVMCNLSNPYSIAKHESYRPQHIYARGTRNCLTRKVKVRLQETDTRKNIYSCVQAIRHSKS